MIWDRGRWTPEGDPHQGLAKGHLTFDLDGEKLHGRWHLVRLRARPKERRDNWLLIKSKDEAARGPRGKDILEEEPLSVATGRSMDEIAEGKGKKRVWHSNRDAKKARRSRKRRRSASRRRNRGRAPKPRPEPVRRKRAHGPRTTACLTSFRRALPPCTATRRAAANGCTRSNTTAIASRRGSIAARCAC